MTSFSIQFAKRFAVTALVFSLLHAEVKADITYSWSGRLELFNTAEPDPWLIGPMGADFVLQTTVSSTASDMNESEVPFAQFTPDVVRLWVNNQELDFVGDGTIDFADSTFAPDAVTAGGSFTKLGQKVFISSVVGLAASTFSFSQAAELSPYFSSTPSSALGQAVQHPYIATVRSGSLITVVPEPSVMSAVVIGLMLISSWRCSGKRQ